MAKWTDLLYRQNKYEKEGYEYVQMLTVLNKTVTVCDYELYGENTEIEGVRILLDCPRLNKKVFTSTTGKVVVNMFKEHQEDIKTLIESKTPVKFVNCQSATGKRYLTVEDVE